VLTVSPKLDFRTLRERIGDRRVVLDENMLMSNIRGFLTNNHISWRTFRKGVTDEDIVRHLFPDEVVITADRRFAYTLQERGILVPLTKSHYEQMQHLLKTIGRSSRGGSLWADISTCPICTQNHGNVEELTWWDIDHSKRHILRPVVQVRRRKP
jgi:hypothetical protein